MLKAQVDCKQNKLLKVTIATVATVFVSGSKFDRDHHAYYMRVRNIGRF